MAGGRGGLTAPARAGRIGAPATLAFFALAFFALAPPARAQDMEPRAYSPSPVGTNFLAVVVGNSRGAVLFDPTVPITDARADLYSTTVGYARAFGLGTRQGLVAAASSRYVRGDVAGKVFEESRQVQRSGLALILRLKVSLNLVGTEAMTREQFAKVPRRTIVGASLTVQAPTGQYDSTKLDLHRHQPLGIQARGGGVGSPAPVVPRRVRGGVVLHEQRPVLPRRHHAPAGSAHGAAGPCQLRLQVPRVAGDRRDLVRRRGGDGGLESAVHPPEQQPPRRDRGDSAHAKPVPEVRRQHGRRHATGTDFQTYLVGWQLMWFDHPQGEKR